MKNKRIIKANFDFQNIIAKQKFIKNSSFVIYFVPSSTKYLQYGISVGKKLGNAVVRNKIKRQIRMMINEVIKVHGDKEFKIIIIARQSMMQQDFNFNQNALLKLVAKL